MVLMPDLPPQLILPEHYTAGRPAFIRPAGWAELPRNARRILERKFGITLDPGRMKGSLPGMFNPMLLGGGAAPKAVPTFIYWSNGYRQASKGGTQSNPVQPTAGTIKTGDLLCLISAGFATPAGYTRYGTTIANSVTFALDYKLAAADDESIGTLTLQSSLAIIRGANQTTPIADLQSTYLSTNSTTLNLPALTTTDNLSLCVYADARANSPVGSINSASLASLTNVTEQSEGVAASSGHNFGYIFEDCYTGEDTVAGAVASGTLTLATTRTNKFGFGFVINPA